MRCEAEEHCITCSDAAAPMLVRRLDAATGLADCVDAGGAACEVDLALLDGVGDGDTVLVHAGVAIARAEEAP